MLPPPRNFKHRRDLHGFSLIESAIVLGVVGVVLGMIWIAANAISERYKLNQLESGMVQIHRGFLRTFENQPWPFTSGGDVSMVSFVVAAGFAPQDMICATNCLRNFLSPTDHINGWTTSLMIYGSPTALKFSLDNLTESQCINVIVKIGNSMNNSVDNIRRIWSYRVSQNYFPPFSPSAAKAACAGSGAISFELPIPR